MTNNFTDSPYEDIPKELIPAFTMNQSIPILEWWFDGSKKSKVEWSSEYIDNFIKQFSIANIENGNVGKESYAGAASLLLSSFKKYALIGKNVAVVGSETPWIEAILLNLQNKVTTIEYNVPSVSDDRIQCISYSKFRESTSQFDCVVSFSSIEHSGLGRYGDPLDPNGDIETMQTIHKNIIQNGLLIWGAPVGHDTLVWNAHRIYGKLRLPLIFENFEELEWFGFKKDDLLALPLQCDGSYQPVICLRKKN